MTDVISRSAAIEALAQHSYESGFDYEKTVELLREMPTIDAQPVIRCKDCKHWIPCQGEELRGHMYCEWAGWLVGGNAYCAYGEV